MRNSRDRIRFETAGVILIVVLAATFVRVGRAGDSPRKDHSKIECSYCHAAVADLTSEEMPNFDLSRQCESCHKGGSDKESSQLSFHRMSNKRCGECHSFHETDQISASGQSFRFRFDRHSSQMAVCASCHGEGENPAMLSEGHKQAAQLYHSDFGRFAGLSPSQSCMLCHSENGPVSDLAASLKVPRFQDHGDHPLGVRVVAGSGEPGNRIKVMIDSRLRLVDGKIECQTCHTLSGQSHARLRDFASLTELCNGCHSLE